MILLIAILFSCTKKETITEKKPVEPELTEEKPADMAVEETIAVEKQMEINDSGALAVESSPDLAQVYVGEEYRGDTPINLFKMSIGNYEVTIRKEGYADYKKSITIRGGMTEKINVTLTPEIVKEPKISSITTKDKTFLKDSKGLPVATKIISELVLEGNKGAYVNYTCKLRYADELVGSGINGSVSLYNDTKVIKSITLLNPVEGKLDISRWTACCNLKTKQEFTDVTSNTVCAK
jgi:hypothetical protein